jgi:cobyrinic acid a,c-diamide synthase
LAHLYISAAHKSSGKTTLSVGISAALTRRGRQVQTYKKGPDYIDPLWLARATGRPCYNLDYNTQSRDEIETLFARRLVGADLGLIEGNKGLYDGVALDGHDSNAALAVQLGAPVILVADVTGITRGIAPLLVGYRAFGPDVHIAGVILNKVVNGRQEEKLRAAVETYTDLAVVGAVPRRTDIFTRERHLGLIPPEESGEAGERIGELALLAEQHIDIDRLTAIAQLAMPPRPAPAAAPAAEADVTIAIARDSAFGFYYADDLEALASAGAKLVFFNALSDPRLPAADGLFIGGGFPETHMQALEANALLRADIRAKAAAGLPVYAECGGLMYLAREIRWGERKSEMVGVVPGTVTMHARPQGRGLVRLRETGQGLWPQAAAAPGAAEHSAHEFHYASLDNLPADTRYAFAVLRGHGIDGRNDGVVVNNVQAGFAHHRATRQDDWARRFVAFVRRCKRTG